MKKLLLILLCLPMVVLAQQTYIPDDNFEQELINQGYDNVLDNYVTTSSINTVTHLNVNYDDITDLTGIEDFTALTSLQCHDNQLTSLDVSNNTALTYLRCSNNQLTSLDISNNPVLDYLDCKENLLIDIDVSYNILLTRFFIENNQLTCLDISQNTVLNELQCNNNLLDQLNTKNGNWVNGVDITAHTNNLTCVEVDNLGYASTNWSNSFDNFVTFNTNCNYANPCASVTTIQEHTTNKELLKVTDLLGRETKGTNQPLFYIYDDGTVEKNIIIE